MRDRGSTERFRFSRVWVVVGIAITVGIVGILVIGLRRVKEGSKIKRAENEIRALVSAINSYESHYGAPPVSDLAKKSVTALCPDLTFGTVNQSPRGRDPFLTDKKGVFLFAIANKGNDGYQNSNAEVIGILLDAIKFGNGNPTVNVNHSRNPEHIVFLEAKQVNDSVSPGIGSDGVFRDPWGNPYIITLDLNDDNKCVDSFYYPVTKASLGQGLEVPGQIMIWSFGPDGTASPTDGYKAGANKDNILSWE